MLGQVVCRVILDTTRLGCSPQGSGLLNKLARKWARVRATTGDVSRYCNVRQRVDRVGFSIYGEWVRVSAWNGVEHTPGSGLGPSGGGGVFVGQGLRCSLVSRCGRNKNIFRSMFQGRLYCNRM